LFRTEVSVKNQECVGLIYPLRVMVLSLIAITLAQAAFEGASIKASDYAQPVLRDDGAQDSLHERAQSTSLVTSGRGKIRELITSVAVLASPVAVVHSIYLWRTSSDEPGVVTTISALVAPTAAVQCFVAFPDTPPHLAVAFLGPVTALAWILYWIIASKTILATSGDSLALKWGWTVSLLVFALALGEVISDAISSHLSQLAKRNQPMLNFFGPAVPIVGLQLLFR
jgi:small-conductance mechanosensitive channel